MDLQDRHITEARLLYEKAATLLPQEMTWPSWMPTRCRAPPALRLHKRRPSNQS